MPTPRWRQMYNAWEQAVSPGLQEVTASTGFRDLMATAMKTNAEIASQIERSSRQFLHLWNLPTATDVRRLRQQVTSLERELMSLRQTIERQTEPAPSGVGTPTKAPTAKQTSKTKKTTSAEPGVEQRPLATTNGTNGRTADA